MPSVPIRFGMHFDPAHYGRPKPEALPVTIDDQADRVRVSALDPLEGPFPDDLVSAHGFKGKCLGRSPGPSAIAARTEETYRAPG